MMNISFILMKILVLLVKALANEDLIEQKEKYKLFNTTRIVFINLKDSNLQKRFYLMHPAILQSNSSVFLTCPRK